MFYEWAEEIQIPGIWREVGVPNISKASLLIRGEPAQQRHSSYLCIPAEQSKVAKLCLISTGLEHPVPTKYL